MSKINMDTGWLVSLIVAGCMMVVIMAIVIPMDRKYIVREKGKINYKKTKIYLRWNVFDTLTLCLAIYTLICVQILNALVMNGKSVENVYVQFFTNQSQAWSIVTVAYLITRVSITLKTIKERWGDDLD